jgi:hypothetical protein
MKAAWVRSSIRSAIGLIVRAGWGSSKASTTDSSDATDRAIAREVSEHRDGQSRADREHDDRDLQQQNLRRETRTPPHPRTVHAPDGTTPVAASTVATKDKTLTKVDSLDNGHKPGRAVVQIATSPRFR